MRCQINAVATQDGSARYQPGVSHYKACQRNCLQPGGMSPAPQGPGYRRHCDRSECEV